MKLWLMFRRPLAVLLSGSLLVAQPGFSALSAWAGVAPVSQSVSVSLGQLGSAGSSAAGLSPAGTSARSISPGAGLSSLNSALPSLPSLRPAAAAGRSLPAAASAASRAAADPAPASGVPASGVEGAASSGQAAPRNAHAPVAGEPSGQSASAAAPSRSGIKPVFDSLGRLAPVSAQAASSRRFFDGAARSGGQASVSSERAAVPSDKIRVYLTRHGKDPVSTDLRSLRDALASDPAYVKSLNERGRVRVVINGQSPHGGLKEADVEGLRRTLESYGLTAKIDVENIPIDWKRKEERAGASAENTGGKDAGAAQGKRRGFFWRYVIAPLTSPVREAAYLLRTLAASLTRPTWGEVIGGIASKGPAMALGVIWWSKTFLPLHPGAFAAAFAASLALNVFHGIWINTWANFQNNIGKQRGIQYQTVFNIFYVQGTGAIFRIITWAVIAGTIPPWAPSYWRDIGVATLFGTFFGTLGYQGLNGLYDKGRIPRWGRSIVQQMRDLFFCLGGTFFGTGSMGAFWVLFGIQQVLDFSIYLVSRKAKRRPTVYVADEHIAATGEFQGMYPVKPGPEEDPLKQALKALLNNPLFKPVVVIAKWVWRVLTGMGKTPKAGGAA
ncbi:MAG: hypothetical protein ABII00_13145 [Elusimicrobiota bacterium]